MITHFRAYGLDGNVAVEGDTVDDAAIFDSADEITIVAFYTGDVENEVVAAAVEVNASGTFSVTPEG